MCKMRLFFLIICTLFVASCATMSPGSKVKLESVVQERIGISSLLIPSEYREVYFKENKSKERYCRSPGPDFSVQSSDGVNLGVSSPILGSGQEKVGFDSGQSAFGLGGRSADVLLTRELMFRACELSSNIDANQETSIAIYERFLATVERLAQVQQEIGTKTGSAKVKVNLPQVELSNPLQQDDGSSRAQQAENSPDVASSQCVANQAGDPCTQTPGQTCYDLTTGTQCWP